VIPYGKQCIDKDDIAAVVETLQSDWLTTGPKVEEFEQAICQRVNSKYAVAVSSGTAALHAAMYAIGIKAGDEVITTPITFAASANCILYQGGRPVFCDINPDTALIDVTKIEALITPYTRAIIAVDYAGQVCDYDKLSEIAEKHNLYLISDACHSLGAIKPVADITIYSFHPVKHITTGEGGMAVTDNEELAYSMRMFRSHGIIDGKMYDLGYNYRITDIQCALGISQLKKLDDWILARRKLAARYDAQLVDIKKIECSPNHIYHLYVIMIANRDNVLEYFRKRGIRATVHYMPIYQHPYYYENSYWADCPVANAVSKKLLSIPLYPGLTITEQDYVIKVLKEALICCK